jgi:hypothetical protein
MAGSARVPPFSFSKECVMARYGKKAKIARASSRKKN